MIRSVFDTNVLASAILGMSDKHSAPGELYRTWHQDVFVLVLSEYLLDELADVFTSPYFSKRLTKRQMSRAMWTFRNRGELVKVTNHVEGLASHPEDDPVLATAISARADFLVTGDYQLRLLKSVQGISVVSPREFLSVLENAQSTLED